MNLRGAALIFSTIITSQRCQHWPAQLSTRDTSGITKQNCAVLIFSKIITSRRCQHWPAQLSTRETSGITRQNCAALIFSTISITSRRCQHRGFRCCVISCLLLYCIVRIMHVIFYPDIGQSLIWSCIFILWVR